MSCLPNHRLSHSSWQRCLYSPVTNYSQLRPVRASLHFIAVETPVMEDATVPVPGHLRVVVVGNLQGMVD